MAREYQKVTLNLRPGDWEYITDIFASKGYPTSVVVRNLVAKYVDHIKGQDAQHEPPLVDIEV